ncbi:hypothetical protein B296_00020099 [Ensete ventricosum]|uniref:Transketolase N-terminal domain-containing protein n=1 Tax=Ensete ventricosum TaxID=4639 RepID=A0A427A956_ENSVE|nr:hypothetical protein B296_00020099 [Ensete ventricosum]
MISDRRHTAIPVNFETPGVEVTTGLFPWHKFLLEGHSPLGHGIANAVGLALAERHLAARFNTPGDEIVDHYTWKALQMKLALLLGTGVTTTIGYGSPNKANSYSVHGSALGAKEVDATRQNLGWPYEPFHVPEDVKRSDTIHWSRHVPEGAALEAEWNAKFAVYEKKYKEDAAELKAIISGEL